MFTWCILSGTAAHAQSGLTRQMQMKAMIGTMPPSFAVLNNDQDQIRKDSLLNEKILDLVKVMEPDSIVPRPTQWHRVAVIGLMLRVLGFRWKAVDMHRHKFVGTVKGDERVQGNDHYSELDMNFNMFPHLPEYQKVLLSAYQGKYKTWKGKRDAKKHQFNYSTLTVPMMADFRLHCELTPPKHMLQAINDKFFPTLPGNNISRHIEWGEDHPTLGMYGPLVLDCNHTCHPEIHPYEWLWWLSMNPATPDPDKSKKWMIGFFKESSSRFRGWTKVPRVGSIAIPFCFDLSKSERVIHLSHLAYGKFMPPGLKKLGVLPDEASDFNFAKVEVLVNAEGDHNTSFNILADAPIFSDGIKWWISDLSFDPSGNTLSGYFHIAVAVKDAYTAKVQVLSK